MKITFGTDGWRGLLGSEMNERSVSIVAQAFSDYLTETKPSDCLRVAIGFDGRENSKSFASLLANVLSANGIRVFLSGEVVPTPVVSYFVKARALDAGVMITASHNPPSYNGIKFKASYGGPFLTEETLNVESRIGKNRVKESHGRLEVHNFLEIYKEHVQEMVSFETIRKAGLKILIDSMGGAGQRILEEMLREYGIEARTISQEAKPDFLGRSPEPIEQNLAPLQAAIQHEDYALGLATDGDADRLGVVQETGQWLSAQETIVLLTEFTLFSQKQEGHIVKTSSVTDKIRRFENERRKVIEVPVGFKYIAEKMIEENVAIGCEESGGYGFKRHIPERDGLLSGLFMAQMLAESGHTRLSEWVKEKRQKIGEIHYDRIDYVYSRSDRTERLPLLAKEIPKNVCRLEVSHFLTYLDSHGQVNGLKMIFKDGAGWLLLRCSETEPLIRVYAEAESNEKVQALLREGISRVETHDAHGPQ